VLGFSPVKSGLGFLPVTFIIGITSGIVSNLVGKIGYKPFMVAGPVTLSIGLFTLSHILKVGGTYWANVFPGLALCALGMGFSFVSGTLAATSGVPRHFSGLASGILNTSQQVGGAIGLAILSAVYASTLKADLAVHTSYPQAQVNGFHNGLRVGSLLALIGAFVALIVIKNQKIAPEVAVKDSAKGVEQSPAPGL
jgi:hypothetical protein